MKLINDPEALYKAIEALPEGHELREWPHGEEGEELLDQVDELLKPHGIEIVRTDGANDGVVFWIRRFES